MSTDKRIENYLAAATAGLRGDRELELDVQAELRSHLEERLADAAAAAGAGTGAADPVADALADMGSATTVAAELAAANQSRMRWRARLQRLGRWLLVPAAVIAALYAIDLSPLSFTDNVLWDGNRPARRGIQFLATSHWLPANWFKVGHRLTPDQALILHGDLQRPDRIQRQRAIWEAHPESRVYFHNYLTRLLSGHSGDESLKAAVAEGRKLDSDNARFDYILAANLLEHAVVVAEKPAGKNADGRPRYAYSWTIKDRAELDQAMALLQAGLAKPEYRRYSREMLAEQLRILGQPQTMAENVNQIARAASVLLPDLSGLRQLARASWLYADLLVREGRAAEAEPFLEAWRPLALQLNGDSFTLIDALVTGAICEMGRQYAPDVWRLAGQPARAEQVRREAERLGRPVADFRNQARTADPQVTKNVKARGSILAAMLLPAIGQPIPMKDLEPGRCLDYIMAERVMLSLAAGWLLLGLAGCGLVYWRWRLTAAGGAAIPLLLLPGWRDTLRVLAYGTLLPLLAYYLYTRWAPWNGREYGLGVGWPLLVAETALLLLALLGVTARLAARAVRRRCRELGIALPSPRGGTVLWVTASLAMLGVAASLAWLIVLVRNGEQIPKNLELVLTPSLVALAGLGLAALGTLLAGLVGRRAFGLYYGSLARTLIPFLALGVIALSLLGKPYLTVTEHALVRRDPLIHIAPNGDGITSTETRLTQRLINEIRLAAEAPPPPPSAEPKK
ncbi:MAG: hypothetical protein WC708_04525 [Lentisphaeria bacterium]